MNCDCDFLLNICFSSIRFRVNPRSRLKIISTSISSVFLFGGVCSVLPWVPNAFSDSERL